MREIYCIWKIFQFPHALSENFLQIVFVNIFIACELRSRESVDKSSIRYWISLSLKLNFTNVPRNVENAFKSINLIKSDFITGNLNPCWMKISWRRFRASWRRKGRTFKWIMKQFMQRAFSENQCPCRKTVIFVEQRPTQFPSIHIWFCLFRSI